MDVLSVIDIDPADRKQLRKNVIGIAWPAVVELILISFFGAVDMIMVGRLGAGAITAVGLTNQPIFLIMAVFQALNVGGTAVVSRAFGSKRLEEANLAAGHVFLITLVFSVLIVVPSLFFVRPIYQIMGADAQVIQIGLNYFKVALAGVIFQNMSLGIAAVLRGSGDTKTPMRVNVVSNVANVVMNYLLIFGKFGFPQWGVTGAGIATTLSRIISFIWLTAILYRGEKSIRLRFRQLFRFQPAMIKRLVRIGFPSAVEQLVLRIGIVIFVRVVAGLGTVIYAAHQICLSVLSLSFTSGMAFGMAASTLIGQSLGSERLTLAEEYGKEVRSIGSVVSALIGAGFFLFSRQIAGFYTTDPEVIENASLVLKVIALIQPMQSSQLILAGALRGAGDTKWPLFATLIGVWGIRLVLAYVFVIFLGWGLIGAWVAICIDQIIRYLIVLWRFKQGKWKYIKM